MKSRVWPTVPIVLATLLVASTETAAAATNDHGGNGAGGVRKVTTVHLPAPFKDPAAFDISWVDQASHTYYLGDRTNGTVDTVNTASDTFGGMIGAGDFTGTGATATAAQRQQCGANGVDGPNGVLTLTVDGVTQLWAGNGVDAASPTSTVKVFNLNGPNKGTLAASIPTAGSCRADEIAYDPVDHLIAIGNDLEDTPYLSFISVNADPAKDRVVGMVKFPDAIDGLEQPAWNPVNDKFYQALPQVPSKNGVWQGEIAVIDPHTMSMTASYPVPRCSPAGLAIDVPAQRAVIGCNADAVAGDTARGVTYPGNPAVTDVINIQDGRIVSSTHQVGGSDQVAVDPVTRTYYLAAGNMTSDGTATGTPMPVLGVLDAPHGQFVQNVPVVAGVHSVAADPRTGQVFVPMPNNGIAVFARTNHAS